MRAQWDLGTLESMIFGHDENPISVWRGQYFCKMRSTDANVMHGSQDGRLTRIRPVASRLENASPYSSQLYATLLVPQ